MTNPMKQFSHFLLEARFDRGITEEEISKEMGFRQLSEVAMWLDGKAVPRLQHLPRLAQVLDLDPIELVLGWVITHCGSFERVIWDEVLMARRSSFPMSEEQLQRLIAAIGMEDAQYTFSPPVRWSEIRLNRSKDEDIR